MESKLVRLQLPDMTWPLSKEHDRDQAAYQQMIRAGIQSRIDKALRCTVQHQNETVYPEPGNDYRQESLSAVAVPHKQEQRGPQKIELLFDRKTPGVEKRRAPVPGNRLIVIIPVEQGCEGVGPTNRTASQYSPSPITTTHQNT
jgi:hypothetical protein